MKTRIMICALCLFATGISYGQTDTAILMDTAMIGVPEEDEIIQVAPMYEEAMPEPPPMADYDYAEVPSFNHFRHKKIKTEEKPDKKAVYSMGTGELLKQITDKVRVPYGYGSEDKYVILQFVVGKDSMLYNPEILSTPGSEYSVNAMAVIERLQEHFVPATKNGKPVDTIITIPIRFEQRTSNDYYRSPAAH